MVGRVGKGALLRAVPTRFPRVRHVRVGTAHATERVATSSIVRRAPLPTLRISLSRFSFHLLYFVLATRYSLFVFSIRHPDEGMAERRQAPGCCEHPVVRAMTGTRAPCFRRPAFPARETPASRRSTVAILRPGPVLAVVRHSLRDRAPTSFDARVIVTRRTRSRGPPAGVCRSANLTLGQPQASLRIQDASRKRPS
jgi:hypothetical protein